MIDGRLLMRDRELLTLNESEVREKANEQAAELFKRADLN
jgi:hypothetical protein